MTKIRYEVDPHNRLVAIGPDRFRTVIDGEFKLSEDNTLVYHVKKSDNIDIPQQVKFSGNWSFDEKHNFIFTLDKWSNQCEGDKLVLKGNLVHAGTGELVFSVQAKKNITILSLSGFWQADKNNRINFCVDRHDGPSDTLVFKGGWSINKHNEIVYEYTKKISARRESVRNLIILRGHWDITKKDKLSYALEHDLDSRLNFNVSFERAQKDRLKYGISIGRGAKGTTISLFGTWKVEKDLGLYFEIRHDGRGAKVQAKLFKTFFKNQGEGFVKTLVSQKEYSVVAGFGILW